jgi:hypothetical protein
LALVGLAIFAILVVRRRKSEEHVSGDQDSSTDGPPTWNDATLEDDEEFVDYVNPLEFSGEREPSPDDFSGAAEE